LYPRLGAFAPFRIALTKRSHRSLRSIKISQCRLTKGRERRYTLQQQGWDFERVLDRAAAIYELASDEVLSRSRKRARSEARSLACFWAVRELGLSTAEMARCFAMTTAAVNYAVDRGERIAAERGLVLDDG
jgi:chromosomal replication initiation ATPase DnaA